MLKYNFKLHLENNKEHPQLFTLPLQEIYRSAYFHILFCLASTHFFLKWMRLVFSFLLPSSAKDVTTHSKEQIEHRCRSKTFNDTHLFTSNSLLNISLCQEIDRISSIIFLPSPLCHPTRVHNFQVQIDDRDIIFEGRGGWPEKFYLLISMMISP